ncbi:MAG: hypothetical protein WC142_01770 [Bacteroidales bacterium]|jgi:hypothetical protein|nr:hypothetical protein [Bacteroidales bacterium]MDD2688143.1 hypothetical protein [Bacteroidales bacterium]MDD3329727.1 hypothetical protein [Bacteroidales bacterium]MDD3690483.1 hypothetical protein [Bacteroidales bacterium]MDD4044326.1 hypothetical protein [Bacteroidales bacterium]
MKTPCIYFSVCIFLLMLTSCDKKEDVDDKTTYTNITRSIVSCISDIHNQNLAGRPTGAQNMTVGGPLGGEVIIEGSTGVADNGISTMDLNYTLSGVNYIFVSQYYTTNITLNGVINEKGSFNSETQYVSINYSSSNLQISGSIYYSKNDKVSRTINESGSVSINRSWSTTNGYVFGQTVTY